MPTATPPNALLALHGAVVLFGFAGLFGKWLLLSPVLIVLGRTLVAAVTLAAIGIAREGKLRRPDLRMLAGGAVLALHWVTFFQAIQVSSVAVGLLGYAAFPVFTLGLERILLGRPLQVRDAGTAVLVVGGLALVVPGWSFGDTVLQGLAWGLASAFTFALLAVLNRGAAARRPARDIALWQNAAAALCLVPFAGAAAAGSVPAARDLLLILVLGVACTAYAHTLFIASLRTVTAHVASVTAALEPAYGMVLAWVLLGEFPTLPMWMGATLLILAAVVAARSARLSAADMAAPPAGTHGRGRRV